VIRTLDDDAVTALRRSAEKYIENWKRFSSDLQIVQE